MAELKSRKERVCLADYSLFRENAYVDGRWCAGGGAVQTVSNPATGRVIGAVPMLDEADTKEAICAAERAFVPWRALLPQERSKRLNAWYNEICAAKKDLAALMTLEQGKPLDEARGEIDYSASFVEWYAEEAKRVNVESVMGHLPDVDLQVQREPIGVVAIVTPWNFPSAMITRKAAAALAAGCTVVAYPSLEAPFSALALAELADRAGIPAGVFNVVTGQPAGVVDVLCSNTTVRALSFTGSTEIGCLIAGKCASSVKALVLELGGHAPFIVFEDADLDKAVESALSAKFATSGQDCLAANRIFVARPIYDAFVDQFTNRTAALKVGCGFEPAVDIGPLINERAVAKAEHHVADAMAKGANLRTGGKRVRPKEAFFEPTVLVDVPEDALIMQEETFGPVAAIAPFDGEDEVIRKANDTDYGLVAYVHTRDYARMSRVTKALEFGMVAINRTKITGPPIPFGGVKQSGLGREGSRQGMEAFTELKYVCLDVT